MQKKKKRMYDGGKSVLHVKNSAGGFYEIVAYHATSSVSFVDIM